MTAWFGEARIDRSRNDHERASGKKKNIQTWMPEDKLMASAYVTPRQAKPGQALLGYLPY
jgi:hypothetical protein